MQKEQPTQDTSHDAASLRKAFEREGCPVCTVVLESMNQVMDSWNYEGFTDVEHRHELIRSRGFCPLHTWQLAKRNNAFQLAVVYREVLADMLANLDRDEVRQQVEQEPGWITGIKRWLHAELPPPSPTEAAFLYVRCPLCHTRSSIEQRLTQALVGLMQSEEAQTLLRQSTGLCQLHFIQACGYARERAPIYLRPLIECQRACLRHTLEEVQELVRKHDYRFLEEARGEEMTSWRRAAELCAGNPGVW